MQHNAFPFCSVISGVGELDIEKDTPKKADAEAKDMPYPDCPFLLLDVRDRDAYDQCHIVGGEEPQSHRSPCQLGSHAALRVVLAGFIFPPRGGHCLAAGRSLHSSSAPIPPGKGCGDRAAVNPLVSGFPNLLYSYKPMSVVFQTVRNNCVFSNCMISLFFFLCSSFLSYCNAV